MRLRRKADNDTPPLFADLMIETPAELARIDPDIEGWLYAAKPLFAEALRIGLVLKRERKTRVWLHVHNDKPAYFSRVIGRIDEMGHTKVRVACVEAGDRLAWLHEDGTVEVGKEPSV